MAGKRSAATQGEIRGAWSPGNKETKENEYECTGTLHQGNPFRP